MLQAYTGGRGDGGGRGFGGGGRGKGGVGLLLNDSSMRDEIVPGPQSVL